MDLGIKLLYFFFEFGIDALVEDTEHFVLFLDVLFDVGIVLLLAILLPVLHTRKHFFVVHRNLKPLDKCHQLPYQ